MGLRKTLRRIARNLRTPPAEQLGFSFEPFSWLLSREPSGPSELATASGSTIDDSQLVRRVMKAYTEASVRHELSSSFWDRGLRKSKGDVHDALVGRDEATAANILRNPASNTHFWGFDAIAATPAGETEPHEAVLAGLSQSVNWRTMYALWLHDSLASLADAVGARRVNYPESTRKVPHARPDELLGLIAGVVGRELVFPNPYAGELGLKTRRGVLSFRAIQSLYQGWRISQLAAGRPNFRVLEIGAGLGRTAYFAHQFGINEYTIIDIPLTGAAQGYFLGRTLGEKNIGLYGENQEAPIRVLPAGELSNLPHTFDLVVNVDSWTEMSHETALKYWAFAKTCRTKVLSINHEVNPFTARSLYAGEPSISVIRYPYWMRRGYLEEVISFS